MRIIEVLGGILLNGEGEFLDKRSFITEDSVDSLVLEDAPEFLDYLFFHNVLDKFCWLIKFHYSDRETVKRKRYRIDTTFQRFVKENYCVGDSKQCQDKDLERDKIEYHLTKGWLNEAVRSDPLNPDYLEAGTMVTRWDGPGSGGLVSWNIIQSYYAVYEYLSCLVSSLDHTVDTRSHRGIARQFANNLLGRANGSFVFYPFNLTSKTPVRGYIPEHPDYLKYHYASYPREPGRHIDDLEIEVERAFGLKGGSRRRSVFDFLYDLRLWSNYTGVQALRRLGDGGYQKFMMRNIALVLFFFGGMAELATINAFGQASYLGMLSRFSRDYIDKHERFARSKFLVPFYIRLRSYKHLGIVTTPINFIIPQPSDPVQFIQQ